MCAYIPICKIAERAYVQYVMCVHAYEWKTFEISVGIFIGIERMFSTNNYWAVDIMMIAYLSGKVWISSLYMYSLTHSLLTDLFTSCFEDIHRNGFRWKFMTSSLTVRYVREHNAGEVDLKQSKMLVHICLFIFFWH